MPQRQHRQQMEQESQDTFQRPPLECDLYWIVVGFVQCVILIVASAKKKKLITFEKKIDMNCP